MMSSVSQKVQVKRYQEHLQEVSLTISPLTGTTSSGAEEKFKEISEALLFYLTMKRESGMILMVMWGLKRYLVFPSKLR